MCSFIDAVRSIFISLIRLLSSSQLIYPLWLVSALMKALRMEGSWVSLILQRAVFTLSKRSLK